MGTLKHQSSLITLTESTCTNCFLGFADAAWLLFYLGGKAEPHSPYTDMEHHDNDRIYFTEFDDFEIVLGAQAADMKRLLNYGGTPKDQIPLKRWTADYLYGYRPQDIRSFTWKDWVTHGGVNAQLHAVPTTPAHFNIWKLVYFSTATNEPGGEHSRMLQTFFRAIDGSTLRIVRADSIVAAAHQASEAVSLSNTHGGVPVGYDNRAYLAIKQLADQRGIDLGKPINYGGRGEVHRELPLEWRQQVGL